MLTGKIIYVGILDINGEKLNGVFIECDPEELAECLRSKKISTYDDVIITKKEDKT
jgi:hypothetical protein